jgi:hypothetical protein
MVNPLSQLRPAVCRIDRSHAPAPDPGPLW